MKRLLDTHVFLALIEKRLQALSPSIHRLITEDDGAFYVSVVSLWEIAIKWRLGKLQIAPALGTLPELISGLGMGLISINEEHALAAVDPEPNTRDPFDRMLLAQCQVEQLRLVTLDRALVMHPLAAR